MPHDYPRFSDSLIPLETTRYDYRKTSISHYEGEFLWNIIRENQYRKTIEIGCALGVSSLYICDATAQFENPFHTIIDPKQTSDWDTIGIRNLHAHGISNFLLHEEPSEIALPKLLEQNQCSDFAFIDGWHTFDHSLIDFFYLNRMLRVGGMIVYDDATWPSISKLLRYLSKYPAYKLVLPSKENDYPSRNQLRLKLSRILRDWGRFILNVDQSRSLFSHLIVDWLWRRSLPPIVDLQKIAEDQRGWDWYEPF